MILKQYCLFILIPYFKKDMSFNVYIITVGDHSIEISGLAQSSQLFDSPFQLSLQPAISSMLSFLSCHHA